MTQIISEILGLSKMNWNSFGLYTKMPCTIESSNQIARIGWLLSNYEGQLMNFDILCRYPISVGSYIRFADTWVDEQMNSRKMCITLAVTLIKRILFAHPSSFEA